MRVLSSCAVMGTTRVRVLCVRCHRRCHRDLRLLSRTKPLVTAPTTGAESKLRTTRSDDEMCGSGQAQVQAQAQAQVQVWTPLFRVRD